MRTYLDCAPYFMLQALDTALMTTDDEPVHEEVLRRVAHEARRRSRVAADQIPLCSRRITVRLIGMMDRMRGSWPPLGGCWSSGRGTLAIRFPVAAP